MSTFRLSTLLLLAVIVVPVYAQQTQSPNDSNKQNAGDTQAQPCAEAETLKRNVQQLSYEIQQLKGKLAGYEKDRLATTLQEQLEREQDRGEKFQLHLIEISEKEAPLLARMDQINQQLKPEAVERTLAGVGSVHPEDLRDETKKAWSNERFRVQMQLDVLRQDRYRTQQSLATTDAAIARLKLKLQEALR